MRRGFRVCLNYDEITLLIESLNKYTIIENESYKEYMKCLYLRARLEKSIENKAEHRHRTPKPKD